MKGFEKTRGVTSEPGAGSKEDVSKIRTLAYAQGLAAGTAGGKHEHNPYTGGIAATAWNDGFRAAKAIKGE